MIKILGRKQCLVVTISLLIIFSVLSSSGSYVQARQPTIQEKSLYLLDDLAGINLAAYSTSLSPLQPDSYLTLSRQTADFTLSSDSGNLRVRCSFIGDFLQKIYISDISGEVKVNSKGATVVDDAKSFLQRYQAHIQDSFYENLQSMLDGVGANENTTKVAGDIKLDVKVYDPATAEFTWTYVDANGVLAPAKNVNLAYEQGNLKYFVNNWQLYTVAYSPQISREQAVDLALDALAKFSYNTTVSGENVSVSGFKVASVGDVSLCYLNYQNTDSARNGDPFVLFPSWFVPLGFDKFYPGSVSGVYIRLWADTGNVCDIVPMVVDSAGAESSDAPFEGDRLVGETAGVEVYSSSNGQVYASLVVVPVVLVVIGFCLCLRWRRAALFFRFKSSSSRRFVKPWSVLLCALMLAGSVFVLAPPTQALVSNNAVSLIFGSQIEQFEGVSEGELNIYFDELGAISDVTTSVYNSFSDYDSRQRYFGFNKNQMLSAISDAETGYDSVAVLYIGHKLGPANTYWVEENPNVGVDADDIQQQTSGKTYFVWSWSCDSATSPFSGLPVAWTNNQLNDGRRCYIGFDDASPALSAASFKTNTGLGKDFITQFYYYALSVGLSIQDSLNEASLDVFNTAFNNSPLNGNEFETYWPVDYPPDGPWAGWASGYMRVYGNENIKLHPSLTLSARDNYDNQLYPTFYINEQPVGTGSGSLGTGTYTFNVSDIAGYTFDYFHFDYGSSTFSAYYRPVDQWIPRDCVLTIYYDTGDPPPPPPPPPDYYVGIYAVGDSYEYLNGMPIIVDSEQCWSPLYFGMDEGWLYLEVEEYVYHEGYWWVFCYWEGDGVQSPYSLETSVYVDSNVEIYAVYACFG